MRNSIRSVFLTSVCATLMLSLSACGYARAKKFEKLLEKDSGQNFSIQKLDTETEGYVVFKNDTTGEYVAYNLAKFDRKNMKSLSSYLSVATGANDVVHNLAEKRVWQESGYTESGGGYWTTSSNTYTVCEYDECHEVTVYDDYYVEPWSYWVDTSSYYYWYEGAGMRFSTSQSSVKDLETLGAIVEKAESAATTKLLSVQYGLSQDRAEKLAKLGDQFKQITSQRELSTEDKDYFAKAAIGVDYAQYSSAMKDAANGKKASMDALVQKASALNGTSPEHTQKILKDLTGTIEE